MFDTVTIVRPQPDVDAVVAGLDRAVEHARRETGEVSYTGFTGQLYVRATPKRLRITGSLTNWLRHLGWSGRSPTREDIRAGRHALEDRLCTDLGDAAVWRADVFADLVLPSPVRCYLPLLLARDRLQRGTFDGTSVTFFGQSLQVAFYDKADQRGKPVATGGLLRMEVRLLKRVAEQMERPVCFADLHDPRLWAAFVTLWEGEYAGIQKGHALHAPAGPYRWQDHIAQTAMQIGGAGEYIEFFKAEFHAGRLTRSQYHSARRALLRAARAPELAPSSSHLDALDGAVADAARVMREGGA